MKKIFFVFGTRPEAIKLAPVITYFKEKKNNLFKIKICITAQHRQMLDEVLNIFKIKPDYDLNIMQESQSLFYITSTVLNRIKKILDKEKPDLIVVHGDTTTTFATALACYYEKISVAHIEAGLRTYDKLNPYPEEINRVLTDTLVDYYFSPTQIAKQNLIKENVSLDRIFVTGNTVIDALYLALKIPHKFNNKFLRFFFSNLDTKKNRVILLTAHRRENFGTPLLNICYGVKKITKNFSDVHIIYPVHLNPNVYKPVNSVLGKEKRIHLIPPLNYLDFVNLMKRSYLILTDSGGLQEEAPSLKKPVLVLRKVTERPEGVKTSALKIVGTDSEKIFKETANLLLNKKDYIKMTTAPNPYGDGKASQRIYKVIKKYLTPTSFHTVQREI